ncbi:MAG: gamma-glutamylcyclotransferase [Desulfovibrionaceae bacterium]
MKRPLVYKKHLVFVYGTLKQGLPNHFFIAGQPCLGAARTCERYALVEGEYPMVDKTRAVSRIRGEVYEVGDPILKRLDTLEDHPAYYRREPARVELEDGREVTAWLYFFPAPQGRLIPDGDWRGGWRTGAGAPSGGRGPGVGA